MSVLYNFKKGIDLPSWHWLNPYPPGSFFGGIGNAYDGARYIYWAVQRGTTTNGTASTTELWRYDTWTNGWQFVVALTAGEGALDIEYDPIRNVIWILEATAATSTSWRYFNLNTTSITLAGLTTGAWLLSSAIATVLPAAQSGTTSEGTIEIPNDGDVPALMPINRDLTTSTLTGAQTTTALSDSAAEFHPGMVGLYVRLTSGAQSGQTRLITGWTPTGLTVQALPGAPSAGDSYVIEVPGGLQATGLPCSAVQTASTIQAATAQGWTANYYRDADVVIVSGTGAGQRRRIASNDGQTLTLAGAVAGNPRTGNWSVTPDNTSTFRIIPSSDFVWYAPGNAQTLYRADVVATTLTWTQFGANIFPAALGAGSNGFHTPFWNPFSLVFFRGGNTATMYQINIGLATAVTLTSLWGGELLTTGGTAARIPYRSKFFVHIAAQQRVYLVNTSTGNLEPFPLLPYASPSVYSGKNVRFIRTVDGADFCYFARKGGQEFFRVPVEWL